MAKIESLLYISYFQKQKKIGLNTKSESTSSNYSPHSTAL